jgi:hypothetical protein
MLALSGTEPNAKASIKARAPCRMSRSGAKQFIAYIFTEQLTLQIARAQFQIASMKLQRMREQVVSLIIELEAPQTSHNCAVCAQHDPRSRLKELAPWHVESEVVAMCQ